MEFTKEQTKKLSKWLIGIATICILIYLSIKNINVVDSAVSWIVGLISPLILGFFFALIDVYKRQQPACPYTPQSSKNQH